MLVWKSWKTTTIDLVVTGFAGWLGIATPASAATPECSTAAVESIPMTLVGSAAPGEGEHPSPLCVGCRVIVTRTPHTASLPETTAKVAVTYHHEDNPSFVGTLELTVSLLNGERRTLTITGVSLTQDETTEYEIEPGNDWSWTDADYLWVELLPMS